MDNFIIIKARNVGCLRHYTWCHFRSSLTELLYTYSGELELRALACSTIYANKTDIETQNNSWEAAWQKKHRDSSSRSKVLPERLLPCLPLLCDIDCCYAWRYVLFVEIVGPRIGVCLSIFFPEGLPEGSNGSRRHLLQWLKVLIEPPAQSSNIVHI